MLTNDEVDEYITNNFTEVMNTNEQTAYQLLLRVERAEADGMDYEFALRKHRIHPNPEVNALMMAGYEWFIKRVRDRVVAENAETGVLKQCPRCEKLLRTPSAKQCRYCFHSWSI